MAPNLNGIAVQMRRFGPLSNGVAPGPCSRRAQREQARRAAGMRPRRERAHPLRSRLVTAGPVHIRDGARTLTRTPSLRPCSAANEAEHEEPQPRVDVRARSSRLAWNQATLLCL